MLGCIGLDTTHSSRLSYCDLFSWPSMSTVNQNYRMPPSFLSTTAGNLIDWPLHSAHTGVTWWSLLNIIHDRLGMTTCERFKCCAGNWRWKRETFPFILTSECIWRCDTTPRHVITTPHSIPYHAPSLLIHSCMQWPQQGRYGSKKRRGGNIDVLK